MTTTVIYGGSFNPPTLGHLFAVMNILTTNPDVHQVIIIPCFQQSGKELLDFEHRYQMCVKTFDYLNSDKIFVSEAEAILGGESLSYRTVQYLKNIYKYDNFRFAMGADLRESYKTWEGSDIIDKLAPPLFIERPGYCKNDTSTQLLDISSTILRKTLQQKNFDFVSKYLTHDTLKYIIENNLYLS